jgi:hypothetical protein
MNSSFQVFVLSWKWARVTYDRNGGLEQSNAWLCMLDLWRTWFVKDMVTGVRSSRVNSSNLELYYANHSQYPLNLVIQICSFCWGGGCLCEPWSRTLLCKTKLIATKVWAELPGGQVVDQTTYWMNLSLVTRSGFLKSPSPSDWQNYSLYPPFFWGEILHC